MEFTHRHVFTASMDRVAAMLADEAFSRRRAGDGGEVWVDGGPDTAFTVSIRRAVPASQIPKEVRSFVGQELHVRYTEAWQQPDGADRVGTFAVEIVGAPGHAAGAVGLRTIDGGVEFLATGEVRVQIPLVGALVERGVKDAVVAGLEAELREADAWLTAH